jgi:hypothetical protein
MGRIGQFLARPCICVCLVLLCLSCTNHSLPAPRVRVFKQRLPLVAVRAPYVDKVIMRPDFVHYIGAGFVPHGDLLFLALPRDPLAFAVHCNSIEPLQIGEANLPQDLIILRRWRATPENYVSLVYDGGGFTARRNKMESDHKYYETMEFAPFSGLSEVQRGALRRFVEDIAHEVQAHDRWYQCEGSTNLESVDVLVWHTGKLEYRLVASCKNPRYVQIWDALLTSMEPQLHKSSF